ncbi:MULTISPECIES: hypothetical protein [Halomonas]|uniref:hypothetical protein n=1 Tax=Halomonas TaxID=2745 RepID=UPI001C97493F|nr:MULTISPECIES: hypothetical protein [Halomonas]MBY6209057.1 hypothetical protein [Halomonas sp. DP3Y7-2]MBY6229212.1 hypothetical protein [Halomonas sp. DP3Y7-1]MCA0917725.1 hypothetical protein [Halomonas denitrificans]
MTFLTTVAGIPCRCKVTFYSPGASMRTTGWGYGDCDPGEPEEFEFDILDRRSYPAAWLEAKLVDTDYDRLLEEYRRERDARAA